MKRPQHLTTIASCCLALLLAAMSASCGGKNRHTDWDDEDMADISDGLLGSIGEEIVTQMAKFDELEQTYKQSLEGLDRSYEQEMLQYEHASEREGRRAMERLNEEYGPKYETFHRELKDLQQRRKKWLKDMKAKLYDYDIAVEVDGDAPIEVVDAFVQDINSNRTITIVGLVELTADRPHISDRSLYGTDDFKLTIVPVDEDDDPLTEVQVLPTDLDRYDQDYQAGHQAEFVYDLHFDLLSAKKLLICWLRPVDQLQIVEDISVKGELGMFQLHGPVRECQWDEYDTPRTLGFNRQGLWTTLNGESPFGAYVKVQRDASGRIVKMGDTADEEYRTYKYNADGQLVEMMEKFMDGANILEYSYDDDGNCTKAVSTYSGDEPVTIRYTILKTDDHGNWTKRKDQHGNVEKRRISYYEE